MKNHSNKVIPIFVVATALCALPYPLLAMKIPQKVISDPLITLTTDEPQGVSSETEITLQNQSPSVRDVTIKLDGTEREQEQLLTLRGMVRELISSARQKVERTTTGTTVNRVSENAEILISARYPEGAGQPYKVSIKLRKSGVEGTPQFFDYYPDKRVLMYQQMQTFLGEQLNLEFPQSVTEPVKPLPPMPVEKPTASLIEMPPVAQKTVPVAEEPREVRVVTETESLPTVKPVTKPTVSLAEMPPVTQKIAPMAEEEPKGVRAATEIELKNTTPAVKSVSIKLEGTEREEAQLKVVYGMVREILQTTKLEVSQVPSTEEPINTPVVKVYENLQIVVAMRAPDDEATQPYQVNITLREQGSTGGNPQPFEFYLAKKNEFYQKLRAYLIENANLSPRT